MAGYDDEGDSTNNKKKKTKATTRHRTAPTKVERYKYELDRLEAKIKQAARVELALLNRAKELRDRRRELTDRYDRQSKSFIEKYGATTEIGKIFVPADLPPLFER